MLLVLSLSTGLEVQREIDQSGEIDSDLRADALLCVPDALVAFVLHVLL